MIYQCSVLFPVLEKEISVEEVVVAGKEVELNCSATGFYPEEISFNWTRGALHSVVQNNTDNHADGTFSAYSRLRFTPDSKDNGVTVGCHINHSSLTETLTRLTTLNVTCIRYICVAFSLISVLHVFCICHVLDIFQRTNYKASRVNFPAILSLHIVYPTTATSVKIFKQFYVQL